MVWCRLLDPSKVDWDVSKFSSLQPNSLALCPFVLWLPSRLFTSSVGLESRVATRPSGGKGTKALAQPDHCFPTAWQQVEQQLDGGPAGESGPKPVQYVERTPDPRLQSEPPTPILRNFPQILYLQNLPPCSHLSSAPLLLN